MSVYQKLVELQEEVERLTGIRPYISVDFHTYFYDRSDEDAKAIRALFVESSSGDMQNRDANLQDGQRKWTCYKAEDARGIDVNVHGPSSHDSVS